MLKEPLVVFISGTIGEALGQILPARVPTVIAANGAVTGGLGGNSPLTFVKVVLEICLKSMRK